MRALIQRVLEADVTVGGECTGRIENGLLLLLGFGSGDNDAVLKPMAEKIANLRIFSDAQGRFNESLLQVSGAILVVPQFTLYGDASKGRRPEFFRAMKPIEAEAMFEKFCEALVSAGIQSVERGRFGAHMIVSLKNDGPVTMMLDSEEL